MITAHASSARPLFAGLLALCVLAGPAFTPTPAAADAPPARQTGVDDAFAQLRSPLRGERERGVRALVALLPAVRARIVEALPRAPWSVQIHLIEVLAHDRSAEASQVLLRHLDRTDETQAMLIRARLVRDAEISGRLLADYRRDLKAFLGGPKPDPGAIKRRLDLVALLERAEIEQNFLSRKSKSGSTGYYKGQYDLLRPRELGHAYRDRALAVCTGIALDVAVPSPGVYTTGVYRFLRPHHVDEWELRGMATNAVMELCTREDVEVVRRLAERLAELQEKREQLHEQLYVLRARHGEVSKVFQDGMAEWEDAMGEYADILTCLYTITPDRYYTDLVEAFLEELDDYGPFVPLRRRSMIAGILIRVGWYQRAIRAYEESIRYYGSRALGRYNQACAYASWSLQEGLSAGKRREYRDWALMRLSQAVAAGWSDIGWMNEDRDLDPIRDTPVFRSLVEQIKREYSPPLEDD